MSVDPRRCSSGRRNSRSSPVSPPRSLRLVVAGFDVCISGRIWVSIEERTAFQLRVGRRCSRRSHAAGMQLGLLCRVGEARFTVECEGVRCSPGRYNEPIPSLGGVQTTIQGISRTATRPRTPHPHQFWCRAWHHHPARRLGQTHLGMHYKSGTQSDGVCRTLRTRLGARVGRPAR